jgi:hypothetical protein
MRQPTVMKRWNICRPAFLLNSGLAGLLPCWQGGFSTGFSITTVTLESIVQYILLGTSKNSNL